MPTEEALSKTVSFHVTEAMFKRGQNVPRTVNISEKLREAYEVILKGVEPAPVELSARVAAPVEKVLEEIKPVEKTS
jgi:hypothetical protein